MAVWIIKNRPWKQFLRMMIVSWYGYLENKKQALETVSWYGYLENKKQALETVS